MTEEQRELMEFLAANRDQLHDQMSEGFADLKNEIQDVKVRKLTVSCTRVANIWFVSKCQTI